MSSDSATPEDPSLVLGEKFINGAGLLARLFGLNVFSTTTGIATMRAKTKADMAIERAERKAETELTLIKVDNKFTETIFVSRAGVVISAAATQRHGSA
ncbi:hypothetical protein B484DRAFT_426031 [Ochromonadaceae sp. CCMP2298]|nr:hypothetical protein B484DRAFT_426031 [Ochromonadaceae sp. CCMP2298]